MTGRFAPTPSGRMHIGNVYAMLGAWLSARKTGDSIRLRIEDIDEPRVVPNAAETMMHDLDWLGLNWDGEPVFQSTRHTLYQEALNLLSNLNIDEISDTINTIGISSNDSDSYGATASNTTNTPAQRRSSTLLLLARRYPRRVGAAGRRPFHRISGNMPPTHRQRPAAREATSR